MSLLLVLAVLVLFAWLAVKAPEPVDVREPLASVSSAPGAPAPAAADPAVRPRL